MQGKQRKGNHGSNQLLPKSEKIDFREILTEATFRGNQL